MTMMLVELDLLNTVSIVDIRISRYTSCWASLDRRPSLPKISPIMNILSLQTPLQMPVLGTSKGRGTGVVRAPTNWDTGESGGCRKPPRLAVVRGFPPGIFVKINT
ncbi:hypothetical protein J6590_073191 [Homalodisca vitripennis]|nr:hypothetical protein J6590_073191 [Homalodisca vitripennis]